MTDQMDKALAFLRGFETPEEFIAYCEGQGITGRRVDPAECLVAKAVHGVLGDKRMRCTTVLLYSIDAPDQMEALPYPISSAIGRFDNEKYPHLERP